jgi:hypothetical protein
MRRRLRWRRVGAGERETVVARLAAWPAPAGGAARHMFALSAVETFGVDPLRLAADDHRWALAVVFPGRCWCRAATRRRSLRRRRRPGDGGCWSATGRW